MTPKTPKSETAEETIKLLKEEIEKLLKSNVSKEKAFIKIPLGNWILFIKEIERLGNQSQQTKPLMQDNSEETENRRFVNSFEVKDKTADSSSEDNFQAKLNSIFDKIEELIISREKHGVIIIDVKEFDDKYLFRALDNSVKANIERLKEDYEVKIKSEVLNAKNKLCEELLEEIQKIKTEVTNE